MAAPISAHLALERKQELARIKTRSGELHELASERPLTPSERREILGLLTSEAQCSGFYD